MTRASNFSLSKSKFILGLQCEKALYLTLHKPALATQPSASQQMIFDQGHEVGLEAQKHFPDGVTVTAPYNDRALAFKQTQAAIASGALAIYEATFEYQNVLVKVDILTRNGTLAPWNIVEVKSSTEVKDVYLRDAAIQLYVLRGAGLKIAKTSILHINNQCVYPDLGNLFIEVNVTDEVQTLQAGIPDILSRFEKTLVESRAPAIDIGPQCDAPYECAFKDHCWGAGQIPTPSVFDIPRLAADTKWALYRDGKIALSDLDLSQFNTPQRRMIESTLTKTRFVDPRPIATELSTWKYPLAFLDFETINYAIPRFAGARPYQQIPFQFSCHIQAAREAELTHVEYLHLEASDPREAIAQALVELLPATGSVIAYYMSFERSVLDALAEGFPKYSAALRSIADRLVDPLPLIRANVYDPAFNGSFSIKAVAPAILGQAASYEGMSVGDGSDAQAAFLEMIDPRTAEDRRLELRQGLLEYCKKDTQGMVDLVRWLQRWMQ